MEKEPLRKIFVGFATGLALAVASAAGKSYVDVEKLKTKFEIFVDDVGEMKKDIKWMRNNWHQKE